MQDPTNQGTPPTEHPRRKRGPRVFRIPRVLRKRPAWKGVRNG